jgi:hypothetical protein
MLLLERRMLAVLSTASSGRGHSFSQNFFLGQNTHLDHFEQQINVQSDICTVLRTYMGFNLSSSPSSGILKVALQVYNITSLVKFEYMTSSSSIISSSFSSSSSSSSSAAFSSSFSFSSNVYVEPLNIVNFISYEPFWMLSDSE